jgi:hypothetical protein
LVIAGYLDPLFRVCIGLGSLSSCGRDVNTLVERVERDHPMGAERET